jgi:FG-GAP repeat/Bacterial Ig-like domain (group 1)/Bacterial Ig-like domain (group 3)
MLIVAVAACCALLSFSAGGARAAHNLPGTVQLARASSVHLASQQAVVSTLTARSTLARQGVRFAQLPAGLGPVLQRTLRQEQRSSYGLQVDPWSQQQELTASDGADNDQFGLPVAMSGDGSTALIGAHFAKSYAVIGAAYVFVQGVAMHSTGIGVSCSPNPVQAGMPTTCTATVTDTSGSPTTPTGTVTFSTSGTGTFAPANSCTLSGSGSSASCFVTYASTTAGADTITASYGGDATHSVSSGPTGVAITPGPPATVTVAPPTQTQTVDNHACVVATVKDAFENLISGITVSFSVTGVNMTSSSGTTDANGQTQFCYVGRLFGTDTVRAYVDSGSPVGTATVIWALPVTTPPCPIKITNGGWIIANNGDKASFSGNAGNDKAGNPSGREQYTDSRSNLDVHSINVLAITCSSNLERVEIFGQATVNGSGQHNYRIDVSDPDSTDGSDTYGILLDTGHDSGIHPLGGGHIEIH